MPKHGDGHLSSSPIAQRVKQPTQRVITDRTGPALLFGLAPRGVYRASLSPDCWCALTAPFHPYRSRSAVYFLLHFPYPSPFLTRRMASDGGRYPPRRPVEPGLSSPCPRQAATVQPTPGFSSIIIDGTERGNVRSSSLHLQTSGDREQGSS